MAVESVVNFLVGKIDSWLLGDARERKLFAEVRRIRYELEMMRAFLREADYRADTEQVVKTWIKQVTEAAYEIENVLDEFQLFQEQEAGHSGSNSGKIKELAEQMRELGNQIKDISSRRERYRFEATELGSTSNTFANKVSDFRSLARFSNEDDLVGVENPRNELIKWLVEGESRPITIAVAGMGGLGKTTLVGKVYDSKSVKAHFQCRAWVTVSQSFELEDIFRRMVKEFCEDSVRREDEMNTGKLIETLREFLQKKRYLLILDDVWNIDDWQRIMFGLPDSKVRSRIMVTTRVNEVAACCAENSHIYNLPLLSFEDGWTLFSRKAFRREFGGSCPLDLKELSEKFVKKCGGLPLAIVAMGSFLSTKNKTPFEWKNVYNKLGYQTENNPTLTYMNAIISLSINDLPYHLKSCLFCISLFPEGCLINRKRLIRLWIAEGFIGRTEGRTLEDVADDYFQELINRSLMEVAKHTSSGKVGGCRVHDIVREMILLKSREGNFAATFIEDSMEHNDEFRRLLFNYSSENILMKFFSCIGKAVSKSDGLSTSLLSHLRSLMIISTNQFPLFAYNFPFSELKFLKVLDFEGLGPAIRNFPGEIEHLFLLRYLSFRGTTIRVLLPAIKNLRNLQTLDLRDTLIGELPLEIHELKHLRHLLASCSLLYCFRYSVQVAGGVVQSLRSLQELAYIDASKSRGVIRELGMLTQLRKLGILNLATGDGMELCRSMDEMKCLHKLRVSSTRIGRDFLKLDSVSSPPPLLQSMSLEGCLKRLPHWIPALSNLVYLKLWNSSLEEDPFKALQHLSNLMILHLKDAHNGKELCCENTGFQRLNSLYLSHLENLMMVRVEQGAMPRLQKLSISLCCRLTEVPLGIEHLTEVKELELYDAHPKLLASISSIGGEDYWKISHIPITRVNSWWDEVGMMNLLKMQI